MGLKNMIKNLFTDEVTIEDDGEPVEIKEIKKEEKIQQLPTFMRDKIEKEEKEKIEEDKIAELKVKKEVKLSTQIDEEHEDNTSISNKTDNNTCKFPIEFSEDDFIETRSRQSIHHGNAVNGNSPKKESFPKEKPSKVEPKVSELYKDKRKDKVTEEKKFRATPIISPIYGVLDKNYTPVDMEHSEGENLEEHRHSKNVDFDTVRKKAYGNLTEEIKENLMCENCEYLKEAKQCQKEKEHEQKSERKDIGENLVYDVLSEETTTPQIKQDITLDEATENYYDYGVEYEKAPVSKDVKIVNHEEEYHPKKEIPPVKSSINLLSTLKKSMGEEAAPEKSQPKDLELTDDLFNLIDSMYDERNDS